MKDIGSGRFGILLQDPGKKPYRIWYKYESRREEALVRFKSNKKLSVQRIDR